MNIYIVYKINFWSFTWTTDFMLANSLFEAVKVTKNPILDDTTPTAEKEYSIHFSE